MKVKALFLTLLLTATACSPGLGTKISVPSVPDPDTESVIKITGEPLRVRVGTFMDSRNSDVIAEVNGREIKGEGTISPVVQDAFERYYKAAGANIVLLNAPVVAGEVQEWRVTIFPSFPMSELHAVAKLKVEVRSVDDKTTFRGSYSGESSVKSPFPTESGVRELLADALANAVREAINDSEMLTKISRG